MMAALLRVIAVFRYRIDSDEPQHLHVVWGWTHGLLQYRDIFDNHMPLFHILCAPLLRVVGERADALITMRVAMRPLYMATIALTYQIASSCYPRRLAMWSTVVASLVPGFLLCSAEFRTDDLWAVFWFLAMAILVSAPVTPARVAASGLTLGLAAAVSAKTTLLLLSLVIGGGVAMFVSRSRRGGQRPPAASTGARCAPLQANGIIFLSAFAIPPAAIALYFASRGAWQPFLYGAIGHNVLCHFRASRLIAFPCLLVLVGMVARRVRRSGDTSSIAARRLLVFITAHFYAVAMFCLWPLVEREHWIPYYPLAAVTLVPLGVPAEYAVVRERDAFIGSLDGRPYLAPRLLSTGLHSIAPASGNDTVAVVWSRAAARGFSPFGVAEMGPRKWSGGLLARQRP